MTYPDVYDAHQIAKAPGMGFHERMAPTMRAILDDQEVSDEHALLTLTSVRIHLKLDRLNGGGPFLDAFEGFAHPELITPELCRRA